MEIVLFRFAIHGKAGTTYFFKQFLLDESKSGLICSIAPDNQSIFIGKNENGGTYDVSVLGEFNTERDAWLYHECHNDWKADKTTKFRFVMSQDDQDLRVYHIPGNNIEWITFKQFIEPFMNIDKTKMPDFEGFRFRSMKEYQSLQSMYVHK